LTQGRGGHNTPTQVHDLLRLRGGTTADMDLSDDHDSKVPDPINHLKYKGASPCPPQPKKQTLLSFTRLSLQMPPPPKARNLVGTINLGFAVPESNKGTMNVSLLLKRFMSYAKQTDPEFLLEPLNGSGQCINEKRA
jgi:hypothetical protein